MARAKKNYNDLIAEAQRLLDEAESIKGEKLDVITKEFEKEFKKKTFQSQVISADDKVLKKVVQNIVASFPAMLNKAKTDLENEAPKPPFAPVNQPAQNTNFQQ